jgi:hypothetical protein
VTSIILIIIALVAVKYAFHFDIVEYWKTPQVQGYVHSIETWAKGLYDWLDKTVAHYVVKK